MSHDMNDRPAADLPPFDDAACEREWLAQENAMRRERLHLDPRNDDARTQRYRMLARRLRQPLNGCQNEGLPADFAQQLAAQLGPVRQRFDAPFESSLVMVLCLALLISAGVVLAPYGDRWWHSMIALSQSATSSISLLLALAACVGLTGLLGHWSSARKH